MLRRLFGSRRSGGIKKGTTEAVTASEQTEKIIEEAGTTAPKEQVIENLQTKKEIVVEATATATALAEAKAAEEAAKAAAEEAAKAAAKAAEEAVKAAEAAALAKELAEAEAQAKAESARERKAATIGELERRETETPVVYPPAKVINSRFSPDVKALNPNDPMLLDRQMLASLIDAMFKDEEYALEEAAEAANQQLLPDRSAYRQLLATEAELKNEEKEILREIQSKSKSSSETAAEYVKEYKVKLEEVEKKLDQISYKKSQLWIQLREKEAASLKPIEEKRAELNYRKMTLLHRLSSPNFDFRDDDVFMHYLTHYVGVDYAAIVTGRRIGGDTRVGVLIDFMSRDPKTQKLFPCEDVPEGERSARIGKYLEEAMVARLSEFSKPRGEEIIVLEEVKVEPQEKFEPQENQDEEPKDFDYKAALAAQLREYDEPPKAPEKTEVFLEAHSLSFQEKQVVKQVMSNPGHTIEEINQQLMAAMKALKLAEVQRKIKEKKGTVPQYIKDNIRELTKEWNEVKGERNEEELKATLKIAIRNLNNPTLLLQVKKQLNSDQSEEEFVAWVINAHSIMIRLADAEREKDVDLRRDAKQLVAKSNAEIDTYSKYSMSHARLIYVKSHPDVFSANTKRQLAIAQRCPVGILTAQVGYRHQLRPVIVKRVKGHVITGGRSWFGFGKDRTQSRIKKLNRYLDSKNAIEINKLNKLLKSIGVQLNRAALEEIVAEHNAKIAAKSTVDISKKLHDNEREGAPKTTEAKTGDVKAAEEVKHAGVLRLTPAPASEMGGIPRKVEIAPPAGHITVVDKPDGVRHVLVEIPGPQAVTHYHRPSPVTVTTPVVKASSSINKPSKTSTSSFSLTAIFSLWPVDNTAQVKAQEAKKNLEAWCRVIGEAKFPAVSSSPRQEELIQKRLIDDMKLLNDLCRSAGKDAAQTAQVKQAREKLMSRMGAASKSTLLQIPR